MEGELANLAKENCFGTVRMFKIGILRGHPDNGYGHGNSFLHLDEEPSKEIREVLATSRHGEDEVSVAFALIFYSCEHSVHIVLACDNYYSGLPFFQ